MTYALHPQFTVQRMTIGREMAPLLVIDNLVADAQGLVDIAAAKYFGDVASYYPGVRAKAPLSYQQFVLQQLRALLGEYFGLQANSIRFTMCHFSLVTTPPEKLGLLQRIPHTDSQLSTELAFIHYLFKTELGGTAFYRHRKTGYEVVDQSRKAEYLACVDQENKGTAKPEARYINGNTALYEQVGCQRGVFNRMLVYRRNSLHSGNIPDDFVPDPDPRTGRLSLNGFLAGNAAIQDGLAAELR
ncbi:MAG TPA: DUF6445 family protein [Vicinamibacterales bacterium]|jgi:hypothetical protein|nr:DUF6445 family protein [Vicinamibacterales bacterium]